MNWKRRRFADEYLVDPNATQAAIKAGYSSKTAKSTGQRLLTFDDVKEYIEEKMAEMHDKRIASAEEVMTYLTQVLRGETKAEVVVIEKNGDGSSGARALNKAPDEKERLKAAELLGKRWGVFKETLNVTAQIPVVISEDLGEDDGE